MSDATGSSITARERRMPANAGTAGSAGAAGRSMLTYTDIPADLAEAVRGILNRHELREQAGLPPTIAVTGPPYSATAMTSLSSSATRWKPWRK